MKYLLLIITLLLSSPSWGESISSDDIVINPTDGLVYKKFTTEPFTGSVTPTSNNPSKGSYKKGRAHGVWARFYENGLVYVTRSHVVLQNENVFGSKIKALEVTCPYASVDIDEEIHFIIGEQLFEHYRHEFVWMPHPQGDAYAAL